MNEIKRPFVDYDSVLRAIAPSQYMARALVEVLRTYEPQMELSLRWIRKDGSALAVSDAATVVERLSHILGESSAAVQDVKHALREALQR